MDTNDSAYVDYYGSWGSGYGSPYVMVSDSVGTDTGSASFKWASSAYGADWEKLVCLKNNSFVEHAYLTCSARESSASKTCRRNYHYSVLAGYSSYIINCDHSDFKLADMRGKILHFNSIASTGLTVTISTYVGTMNWKTSQYILNTLSGSAGYVYGDYMGYSEKSGAVIVNAIIARNFKYVYTGREE